MWLSQLLARQAFIYYASLIVVPKMVSFATALAAPHHCRLPCPKSVSHDDLLLGQVKINPSLTHPHFLHA
jgi:hypothetical protein